MTKDFHIIISKTIDNKYKIQYMYFTDERDSEITKVIDVEKIAKWVKS